MTAEQFCLRWNNHQSTLVSVFDGLFESGTLVDCTLAADGQYLKAHKVVLSACSPYLEALLSQHYNQHPIVILKDVKFEELKAMLEYMYRGEVNVTQEQLGRFLKAAETLKIKGLTNNDVGSAAGQITPITGPAVISAAVASVSQPPPPAVASCMSGAGDTREVPVRTKHDVWKSLPTVSPVQPRSPIGNQISLVETLKNAPASLVIDIPPISPVNSKEGSISPTPRKRRKRKPSHNDEFNLNVDNNRQKLNSEVHGCNISEKSNESELEVDPLAILETGIVKPEVKMESGDGNGDDGDSETELTMDEEYDPSCSRAGPSNGSSAAADGGAWGGVSDEGENAESSKEYMSSSSHDKKVIPNPQPVLSIPFHGLSQDHLRHFEIKNELEEDVLEDVCTTSRVHEICEADSQWKQAQLTTSKEGISFLDISSVKNVSDGDNFQTCVKNSTETNGLDQVFHYQINMLPSANLSQNVPKLSTDKDSSFYNSVLLSSDNYGVLVQPTVEPGNMKSYPNFSGNNTPVENDQNKINFCAEEINYNLGMKTNHTKGIDSKSDKNSDNSLSNEVVVDDCEANKRSGIVVASVVGSKGTSVNSNDDENKSIMFAKENISNLLTKENSGNLSKIMSPLNHALKDKQKFIKKSMPVIMDDGTILMKTVVLNISSD